MSRLRVLPFICVALLGSTAAAQTPSPEVAPRHVVLLYDERTELPGLKAIDARIAEVLSAKPEIQIYRESMDLSRFDSESYRAGLRAHLRAKYSGREVAVAVGVMGPALDFLLEHGRSIFPGASVVFAGIDRREIAARALPPWVTGVVLKREFAPTLDLALRLQPATRHVVLVSGTSEFDARVLAQAREELRRYEGRVEFRYLSKLPMGEILAELGRLPPNTIVLFTTFFRDGAGRAFVTHEAAGLVAAAANAPVYGFVDQYLGRGIVGGNLYSVGTHGEMAGRLVLKLLAGASPAELPPADPANSLAQVDVRQLRRWGLDADRLPPGTILQFRPSSVWRDHREKVLGAVLLLVLQTAMISGLLFQRVQRRRAESRLRESEVRFRTMADTAAVMLWISDVDGRAIFCNRAALDFTGTTLDDQLGEGWAAAIHPDDRPGSLAAYRQGLERREAFTFESRYRRYDGEYRWLLCCGVPRYGDGGAFGGYVGSSVDITLRHEAEAEHRRHMAEVAHLNRVATTGVLAASIAHELSQPLTAILYNTKAASLCLDRDPPALDKVPAILASIREDDERATDIIKKIRDLMERRELVRQSLALNPMVQETVQLMHGEAASRHVTLTFEPSARNPLVQGDRVHLQQVVINLVLNALEAVSAAPLDRRRVWVRTEVGDDWTARIEVRDSGPGIPPEALREIFEPFHTSKENGLGLGLSISRTIVEAHEGRLWADGDLRVGASFHAAIPLVGEEEPPRHHEKVLSAQAK